MKSRTITIRDGPYRGRRGTIIHHPTAGWPTEIRIPYPLDAPAQVLVYTPVLNSDLNPTGLVWAKVKTAPLWSMATAMKYEAVYVTPDGSSWIEGDSVEGGWTSTIEVRDGRDKYRRDDTRGRVAVAQLRGGVPDAVAVGAPQARQAAPRH